MFKYEIGQLVWYIKNNCIHSAKVVARSITEVDPEFEKCRANNSWHAKLLYVTIHGAWDEEQLYRSVDDLLYALKAKAIVG